MLKYNNLTDMSTFLPWFFKVSRHRRNCLASSERLDSMDSLNIFLNPQDLSKYTTLDDIVFLFYYLLCMVHERNWPLNGWIQISNFYIFFIIRKNFQLYHS